MARARLGLLSSFSRTPPTAIEVNGTAVACNLRSIDLSSDANGYESPRYSISSIDRLSVQRSIRARLATRFRLGFPRFSYENLTGNRPFNRFLL
jgi:hypothetical protein